MLIPTCEASSFSGNYISLKKKEKIKCVPAAAVRGSLHFHLTDCSLDFRGLRVWLASMEYWFLQVMAVFPHQQCGALDPVV